MFLLVAPYSQQMSEATGGISRRCLADRLLGAARSACSGPARVSRTGEFDQDFTDIVSLRMAVTVSEIFMLLFLTHLLSSHCAGMGLGTRLSDTIARRCGVGGYGLMAKTKHPRLGGGARGNFDVNS